MYGASTRLDGAAGTLIVTTQMDRSGACLSASFGRHGLTTEGGCQLHQISAPLVYSCLLTSLSAGAQGTSHPAESSKVCELDEGRHAVAPDSCHTGSICRYGSSTQVRVLSSGLGAVAFIH